MMMIHTRMDIGLGMCAIMCFLATFDVLLMVLKMLLGCGESDVIEEYMKSFT